MKTSPQINSLVLQLEQDEEIDLEMYDICDDWVSLDPPEDRVSEVDLFERGAELVEKAGDKDIYIADTSPGTSHSRFYFIGTVEEILVKINQEAERARQDV